MVADRIIGSVEQKYRKVARFITPKSYDDILQKYGGVCYLWKQWNIFDHKTCGNNIMRHYP